MIWSTNSQIVCADGDGRCAACWAVTPSSTSANAGPCHIGPVTGSPAAGIFLLGVVVLSGWPVLWNPTLLALHALLLAKKSGRPVKMVYDRKEDIEATTKRHPCVVDVTSGALRVLASARAM